MHKLFSPKARRRLGRVVASFGCLRELGRAVVVDGIAVKMSSKFVSLAEMAYFCRVRSRVDRCLSR